MSGCGAVISLWRYPVKSMMGEELTAVQLSERGLRGDRVYALLDDASGKVATAKNPRAWPSLFAFSALLVEKSERYSLRITLPGGRVVTSEQGDLNQVLSTALHRDVRLAATEHGPAAPGQARVSDVWTGTAEAYWPDMEGLSHRDTVTDFPLPAGTFFDCATVHLLTTATLDRLRRSHPEGRFEVQRFRPNIVVQPEGGAVDFVEDSWIGRTLAIGGEVRLTITGACGRCVMTTLAQGDLPKDSGILKAAVQHNQGHVGVYAAVARGGRMRRGDRVTLCPA